MSLRPPGIELAERQAAMEARLEAMEAREQALMSLVLTLQGQLAATTSTSAPGSNSNNTGGAVGAAGGQLQSHGSVDGGGGGSGGELTLQDLPESARAAAKLAKLAVDGDGSGDGVEGQLRTDVLYTLVQMQVGAVQQGVVWSGMLHSPVPAYFPVCMLTGLLHELFNTSL